MTGGEAEEPWPQGFDRIMNIGTNYFGKISLDLLIKCGQTLN